MSRGAAGAGVILFFHLRLGRDRAARHRGRERCARTDHDGFWLATAFAAVLFAGMLLNWRANPTRDVLDTLDRTEYRIQEGT